MEAIEPAKCRCGWISRVQAGRETIAGMNRFSGLTVFGLVAVTLMLVFYALEKRSHWFVLAFSGSCVLASAYGFMEGAWPFGLIEALWSVIALRRWWRDGPAKL